MQIDAKYTSIINIKLNVHKDHCSSTVKIDTEVILRQLLLLYNAKLNTKIP